jgi:predicted O-methyltransferase YrrM
MDNSRTEDKWLTDLIDARIKQYFGISGVPTDGAILGLVDQLAAAVDSSSYLNTEMSACPKFGNMLELLAAAIRQSTIADGLVLEFGVFSGLTINHLAGLTAQTVHGFDSFEGLPEDWRPNFQKGIFKREGLPDVRDNVRLHVGWFDRTLPGFVTENPGPVGFLHVDCDLYSSTKTIFHWLTGRIVPGTVIVFDEYFNYVGWRNHEYKAFKEFIAYSGLRYQYIGVVPSHQQAAVLII